MQSHAFFPRRSQTRPGSPRPLCKLFELGARPFRSLNVGRVEPLFEGLAEKLRDEVRGRSIPPNLTLCQLLQNGDVDSLIPDIQQLLNENNAGSFDPVVVVDDDAATFCSRDAFKPTSVLVKPVHPVRCSSPEASVFESDAEFSFGCRLAIECTDVGDFYGVDDVPRLVFVDEVVEETVHVSANGGLGLADDADYNSLRENSDLGRLHFGLPPAEETGDEADVDPVVTADYRSEEINEFLLCSVMEGSLDLMELIQVSDTTPRNDARARSPEGDVEEALSRFHQTNGVGEIITD